MSMSPDRTVIQNYSNSSAEVTNQTIQLNKMSGFRKLQQRGECLHMEVVWPDTELLIQKEICGSTLEQTAIIGQS
jgi:hypothetical protein